MKFIFIYCILFKIIETVTINVHFIIIWILE